MMERSISALALGMLVLLFLAVTVALKLNADAADADAQDAELKREFEKTIQAAEEWRINTEAHNKSRLEMHEWLDAKQLDGGTQ